MKPSTILFLLVMAGMLALTVVLGAVFKSGHSIEIKITQIEEEVEKEKAAIIPVHITEVATGSVEDVVYVNGQVEVSDRADVLAKIAMPGKLIEAKVKEGDRVSKNQVLATVDRDEVGAIYLAYGVKAPISGTVTSITSDRGALITAQSPVATIVNIDKVKVITSLIEADLGRVSEGSAARVKVDAYPDRTFNGTITKLDPVLDSFSHTIKAEVTIPNSDHALKPGMFARAEIVADTHSGIVVVPKGVLIKREGKNLCYVFNREQGNIHLTEIQLGYYDRNMYEVSEGLKEGDLVVDQDLVILKDRTLVNLINDPSKPAEPKDGVEE